MRALPVPGTLAEAAERVRVLCALHEFSVTSWGRTNGRNARVGGVATSFHRWQRGGMAWDCAGDAPDRAAMEAFAAQARLCGFDALVESDHVHLEADPG